MIQKSERFKPNKVRDLYRKTDYVWRGISYPILTWHKGKKHDNKKDILFNLFSRLEAIQYRYGHVMVIRFDLHQKGAGYTPDSENLRTFWKNLSRRLKRKYKNTRFHYVWARELETSKSQHYHCVLYMDGTTVKKRKAVIEMAREAWAKVCKGNSLPRESVSHHLITDKEGNDKAQEAKAEVLKHASYLAKVNGKGIRDPQAKDHNASRLSKEEKARYVIKP
jgi:hypothetical protein